MRLKNLILMPLIFISLISCKKQIEDEPKIEPNRNITSTSNSKNPYSVINMRRALAKLLINDLQLVNGNANKYLKGKMLLSTGNQALSINRQMTAEEGLTIAKNGINATHYYIKFIPRDEADYNKIKADSNLVTYPFPLDTETTTYSGSYRDPNVPTGVPTYQYAAVPINYKLPDVSYQKLEDLYLPDEQANKMITVSAAGGSSFAVASRVLAEQSMCGINEDNPGGNPNEELMPVEDDCGGGGGGGYPPNDPYRNGEDWRPHGRITLYDENLQQTIGVEGIKVRARRWFTTYAGITDANGYYAVDGWYTRPANYWLDFERYDFSVNDHRGGPREISGPKIEAAWDVNFDGYDKFCANIFRAAFHYYHKDIQGLRRPPQNSFWATQVKLAAFDWYENSDNGDMWAGRNLLLGSLIHIYHPQNGSMGTYATTIHELAHASHWNMSDEVAGQLLTTFGQSDTRVCETWATGVQWVLTKMEYPNYRGRINTSGNYTNLVMDMIDSPYQEYFNYGTFAPTDQVEGYSIVEIENALRNQKTFAAWQNNIQNLYSNGTQQHLANLFNYWGNN